MKQDYLVLKNLVKIFGSGKDTVIAVDNVNLEATNEARKFIRNEFIEQWKPFRKQKEEKKS